MAKARDLMDRVGRGEEFASYAAEVREPHKPKRDGMKIFDQKQWERSSVVRQLSQSTQSRSSRGGLARSWQSGQGQNPDLTNL